MPNVPVVIIKSSTPITTLIEIEASISETHARTLETTAHPIETGSDIVDHVRFKPRELSLTGIISNTPILVDAPTKIKASVPGGDPRSRAEDAFRELENIMQTGTVCSIATSLANYENMVLVGLATPRDAPRGNIAELQMSWREIRYAETLRVTAPVPKVQANANKKDLSKQSTKATTDKVQETTKARAKSVLKTLFG